MTVEPKTNEKRGAKLAWASLLCGVVSWLLMPALPVGPDVAAVILGILALGQTSKDDRKMRTIAHTGLWLGAAKLLVMLLTLAWVVFAFMRNPVAH